VTVSAVFMAPVELIASTTGVAMNPDPVIAIDVWTLADAVVGVILDTVGNILPVTDWPLTNNESAVIVAPAGIVTVFPDAAIVIVPAASVMILDPLLFWIVSFFRILATSYLAVAGLSPTKGSSANAM